MLPFEPSPPLLWRWPRIRKTDLLTAAPPARGLSSSRLRTLVLNGPSGEQVTQAVPETRGVLRMNGHRWDTQLRRPFENASVHLSERRRAAVDPRHVVLRPVTPIVLLILTGLLASATTAALPTRVGETPVTNRPTAAGAEQPDNIKLAETFIAALNAHDVDAVVALFTDVEPGAVVSADRYAWEKFEIRPGRSVRQT